MPLQIAFSDEILAEALDMPEDERAAIESIKAAEQVDVIIDAAGETLALQLAGLAANYQPQTRAERMAHIANTLDVAIALVAMAEDIAEVERIKKVATMLGRHHKTVVKVNIQELWPALRATFQQIGNEFGVHTAVPRTEEKAFIRRKVKAAIKIINESLANGETRWL